MFVVTGAAGEVGLQVVKAALAAKMPVRAMIRPTSKRHALSTLGVQIVEADLRDQASLEKAFAGAKGIFHVGALYREAGFPDEVYFDVNAEGTRRVFEAAIKVGATRVIHCSTGGVLGDVKNPPGSHLSPYAPGDTYQRSKVEAEKIALEYYRSGKMRGVVIRPAMVYGPGDTRHLKLFRMVARGKFFYVGKGDKSVHFIDIRDLARSFVLAMQREDLNGEIYHIAGSGRMTLHEAVNKIAGIMKVPAPWLHLPVKPVQWAGSLCEALCAPFGISPPIYRRRVDFFTKGRWFDTEKSRQELGFTPARSFDDELQNIIATFRQEGLL